MRAPRFLRTPGLHGLGAVTAAVAILAGATLAAGVSYPPAGALASKAKGATVWLCRPGVSPDPCTNPLTTTVVSADGSRTVQELAPAAAPPVDCFYVYPTVSTQTTRNSNLQIQAGEIGAAVSQASPFSQVCRVWAPMYRQQTSTDLLGPGGSIHIDPVAEAVAYSSLLSAWKDYLAHDNDGRPIVVIGHSQGAAMLIRLLKSQVDGVPALRRRLVSAIIIGGNVQVPVGRTVGGTFRSIPACLSTTQTGCVIAYSSFEQTPPSDSLFGRPGQGVSLQSGQRARRGMAVLCTNPAALGGGTGLLDPSFPVVPGSARARTVTTPWVSYPDRYQAVCKQAQGATWLQVTPAPNDRRPAVTATAGPRWGLHTDDVNLAMGNLVADVASQEAALGLS